MAGFNRAELAVTLSHFLPEDTVTSSEAPTAAVVASTAAGAPSHHPHSQRRPRDGPPPATSGTAQGAQEKKVEEVEEPLVKKRRVLGMSSGSSSALPPVLPSPRPLSPLPSAAPSLAPFSTPLLPAPTSPAPSLFPIPPFSIPSLPHPTASDPTVVPATQVFSTLCATLSPTPPTPSTSVTIRPLASASFSVSIPPGGPSPYLPTGFMRPGTLTPGGFPFPLGLFDHPFSFPGDVGSPLPSAPWRPTERPHSDIPHVPRWSLKEADSVFRACAPSTHQALFHVPTGYDRLALGNLSTQDLVRLSSQSCL